MYRPDIINSIATTTYYVILQPIIHGILTIVIRGLLQYTLFHYVDHACSPITDKRSSLGNMYYLNI